MRGCLSIIFCLLPLMVHPFVEDDEEEPAETIQGIVITTQSDIDSRIPQCGITIEGLDFLIPLQDELESRYLGHPLTVNQIEQIKKEILDFAKAHEHRFIVVDIPEQDISSGVVYFVVVEAHVGQVIFEGNYYTRSRDFAKQIHLQDGGLLEERVLFNDITWLNRNPFHYTEIIVSPGAQKGFSDLEFSTKERFPMRFYAGADNTGIVQTITTRLFAGFTWGDVFNSGDLLSYQFTTAPSEYYRFVSHFFNYTSFLSWQHLLTLYGGYGEIHPEIDDTLHSEGKNWQASLRYTIPFKPLYAPLAQDLSFGFDYKNLNSNLFFLSDNGFSAQIAAHSINLTQGYGGYELHHPFGRHDLLFKLELFASPIAWIANQNEMSYGQLRPGASPIYAYSRMALGDLCQLSRGWQWNSLLRIQAASGPLISSEQMVLAGSSAVRGYMELAFIADDGVLINMELHTPTVSMMKKKRDALYFLLFADFGWGHNFDPNGTIPSTGTSANIPSSETLWGIGPGMRYVIKPYLTFRGDYGMKLRDIPGDSHFGRVHLSAVVSY